MDIKFKSDHDEAIWLNCIHTLFSSQDRIPSGEAIAAADHVLKGAQERRQDWEAITKGQINGVGH